MQNDIDKLLGYVPQVDKIFNVLGKIGEGTFSKVYRATVKTNDRNCLQQEYALKYLVPTSHPSRIANELSCLQELGGSSNIIGAEMCLMERGHVVIVMKNFSHDRFLDYVKVMSIDEMRDYMKNLFIALMKVHSHAIIHRDVKPSNFLYDRENKRYALVDFGLAQRLSSRQRITQNKVSSEYVKKRKLTENQENENGMVESKKRPLVASNVNHILQPINSNMQAIKPSRFSQQQELKQTKLMFSRSVDIKSSKHKIEKIRSSARNSNGCSCFGKQEVCNICLNRVQEVAPRAGTPGFRAPEVLLKHTNQTTAVDMWAAGVMLLSMLTRKYPFFRASDDLSSLAEIACIVGSKRIQNAALSIGKRILLSMQKPKVNIKSLCQKLRYMGRLSESLDSQPDNDLSHVDEEEIPDSVYHLLWRLLDPNPYTRITASEALNHSFLAGQ